MRIQVVDITVKVQVQKYRSYPSQNGDNGRHLSHIWGAGLVVEVEGLHMAEQKLNGMFDSEAEHVFVRNVIKETV